MADEIIDDTIVEEEEEPDIHEETSEVDDYGIRTLINRAVFSAKAGVTEKSRSFTEVDAGTIKFGYREEGSLTRTVKYTVSQTTYTSGGTKYYGIACNAQRIKISPNYVITREGFTNDTGPIFQVGSAIGISRFYTVVTNIRIRKNYGVDWTVESLPFVNGLCVARR